MPKQKITKEHILDAAFALLRELGYENINARSVAQRLGCSVQPIYSYFENMDALMQSLYTHTREYLSAYVIARANSEDYFESMGACHISFAKEELHLFRFLFLSPYQHLSGFADLYRQYAREEATQHIQQYTGFTHERAQELYTHMMIYTHGIACMVASGSADIPAQEITDTVRFACKSFYSQLVKETI